MNLPKCRQAPLFPVRKCGQAELEASGDTAFLGGADAPGPIKRISSDTASPARSRWRRRYSKPSVAMNALPTGAARCFEGQRERAFTRVSVKALDDLLAGAQDDAPAPILAKAQRRQ